MILPVVAGGVFEKVRSGLEGHITVVTLVAQQSLVSQHVDSLVLLTGKLLVAVRTGKWLLTSVQSVMCCQRLLLLKCHRADIAFEGIIFQVTVDVILQLNLVSE